MVTRVEPVPVSERLPALDVVRGIALFGILVVNMAFFGGPLSYALADPRVVDGPAVERAVWWLEYTFFMGKFVSTFSFLFGAGLALQMARMDRARAEARRSGARARNTGLIITRRLVVLGIVGMMHGVLIWYGDILFFYACLGWTLIFLRYLSARVLLWIAVLMALVSVTCMGGMSLLGLLGGRPEPQPLIEVGAADPVAFDVMSENLSRVLYGTTDHAFADTESAAYRNGTIESVLLMRGVQWATMIPFLVILYSMHVLSLFVAGMAAAKSGFFTRGAVRAQTWAMAIGLPVGAALCATGSSMVLMSGWDVTAPLYIAAVPIGEIGTFALAIGYIALATRVVNSGAFPWLCARIACVGRMAFTVYLSESVLMTGLMYWWGLGRFGSFDRVEHFLIAIATWVALTVFANVWLSAFRMGPLEWLWRAVTYLELPKLRRAGGTAPLAGDGA